MDRDFLSQEEIDALIEAKENAAEDLTAQEKDVIGEMGNIAMGSAATALSQILEREVAITTPRVSIIGSNELSEKYERPCVLVDVEYRSFLEGRNLLVVKETDASIIADIMMGGDGENQEKTLGEIELSALAEAMNQMMGASATALSKIFNAAIDIAPPHVQHLSIDKKLQDDFLLGQEEFLVATSFHMQVGDLIDSDIMMIGSMPFLRKMVKRLVEGQQDYKEEEPAKMEQKPKAPMERSEKKSATSKHPNQEQVEFQKAQFETFDEQKEEERFEGIDLLGDIPLDVTVRLGKTQLKIKEVLDLGKGSIIELDRLAGEDVDLLVNGKLVAKGEIVVIEENFAFRVKKIISPMERIKDL